MARYRSAIIACGTIARCHARGWQGVPDVDLAAIADTNDDARDEFGIDLAHSYMIGDKHIDLECGWNAGVERSILVRTGYGAEVANSLHDPRAIVAADLPAAAEWILNQARA